MADETPVCKKCNSKKKMLKGKKRNQFFIGCPNCSDHAGKSSGSSESASSATTASTATKTEKKTQNKNFWW